MFCDCAVVCVIHCTGLINVTYVSESTDFGWDAYWTNGIVSNNYADTSVKLVPRTSSVFSNFPSTNELFSILFDRRNEITCTIGLPKNSSTIQVSTSSTTSHFSIPKTQVQVQYDC